MMLARTARSVATTARRSSLASTISAARGGGVASMSTDSAPSVLASKYARALANAAREKKVETAVRRDARELLRLKAESPAFAEFLDNPTLPMQVKAKTLVEQIAPKAGLNEYFREFLQVVAANGRSAELGQILNTYITLYGGADTEQARGVVNTAEPLDDWHRVSLERQLLELFYPGSEKVELKLDFEVDPTLISGYTAEIGDRFVDNSGKREMSAVQEIVESSS